MALFTTRDTPSSRRLVLVVGALMLAAGLVMSLFIDDPDQRSLDDAAALAKLINTRLAPPERRSANENAFNEQVRSLDLEAAPPPPPRRIVESDHVLFTGGSAEFIAWLFDQIGYTAELASDTGTEVVPPVILLSIAEGWAEDKSVAFRKSLFYRALLPLVLLENRAILKTRAEIEAYARRLNNREPVPSEAREAMHALAVRYRVIEEDAPLAIDADLVNELLRRVDTVPPSLALAQAAYESGYATSRFAHAGNALFGQWDWSTDAMRPQKPRRELGRYGIRAFDFPIDSVRSYLWNLNTHPAYDAFRSERERQRGGAGGAVRFEPAALAATLTAYAERGVEYTEVVREIIRDNDLVRADTMRLIDGDPVFLD